MGRGTDLTDIEKSNIDLLKRNGYSNRKIALEIGRSKKVVGVYLSNPELYAVKRQFIHTKIEGPKTIKRICYLASNKSRTCRKIKGMLGCKVSRCTIGRCLRNSKYLKYLKK